MLYSKCIQTVLDGLSEGLKKHGANFLIGLLDIDDESYSELVSLVRQLMKNEVYLVRGKRSAIISASLVLFAIREYQNNQFWNEFAERISLDEISVMRIGKAEFEEYCRKANLFFHVGRKNKGYVTSILTHAILPNASMTRFFEFLHGIYVKDLEEEYVDEEVEELIQYMKRLFFRHIEDDDISLTIQGYKMTIASQQLPKAFRLALIQSENVVAPIIERLLFYINQLNYGEPFEQMEGDRFDVLFEQHSLSQGEKRYKSRSAKTQEEKINKFKSAQYSYVYDRLQLQIPKQHIDTEYLDNEILLEIYDTDRLLYQKTVSISKNRLFFRSEQEVVDLDQFYTSLSFRLVSGNETIYSSRDSLHRDYIIFDFDGNEIKPNRLTNDTIRIITNSEIEVLAENTQSDVSYKDNYRVTNIYLNDDSLLLIGNTLISTNPEAVKNQTCSVNKHDGAYIREPLINSLQKQRIVK